MARTMRLITLHGRDHPDQNLDDWGYDGPTIDDVVAVHAAYGTMNVFFASDAAAEKANHQTGWSHFDRHALTMQFHDDLLVLSEVDGRTRYYGDWEFQTQTGAGDPIDDAHESPNHGDVYVLIEMALSVRIKG